MCDVEKKGAAEVAIEVLMTHCSPETAVCEVFVNLNNDDGTVLKVVAGRGRRDRLQQRRRGGKITAVRCPRLTRLQRDNDCEVANSVPNDCARSLTRWQLVLSRAGVLAGRRAGGGSARVAVAASS